MKDPLGEHDHIVTAWGEYANGPGWSNTPLWVLVRSALDGSHRVVCVQPEAQSGDILALFRFSALAHEEMTGAVRRLYKRWSR